MPDVPRRMLPMGNRIDLEIIYSDRKIVFQLFTSRIIVFVKSIMF